MESSGKTVYRYCIVPKCNNTTKTTPQKVFFLVPRNANIRIKWCKAIKRDEFTNQKLSATSCLYCCEDHFDLEEDTENFIQYQIMSKQQGVPVTLRLRKGVLPHKFQCQKENKPVPVRQAALKRQRLSLVQDTLSQAATRKVITETKLCGGPADTTITREINYCEAGTSSSSHDVFSTKSESLSCDKAVQVNTIKQSAIKYGNKGVNVGSKTKNVAVSPFIVPVKDTSTSPIKTASIAGTKRKLFPDIKPTGDLSLTSQSSSISSEYEQESTSSEASWAHDNEDRQFKNLRPPTSPREYIFGKPNLVIALSVIKNVILPVTRKHLKDGKIPWLSRTPNHAVDGKIFVL
ncbi:hypothetical protein JTB14_029580 [Gonioctena quinquepunctata]|nr:hypothetical protein JTB14_029580 [Gonioctena quinquepunctata]